MGAMAILVGFFTMVIIGIIIQIAMDIADILMASLFTAIEVTDAPEPIGATRRVATIAKGGIAADIYGVTGTCAVTAICVGFAVICGA